MFKRLKKIWHAAVDSDADEAPPEPQIAAPEPQIAVPEPSKMAKIAPVNIPLARKSSRSTTSSSLGQRIRKKVRLHSPERPAANIQSIHNTGQHTGSSMTSQIPVGIYTVESFYRDQNGNLYPLPAQTHPPPLFPPPPPPLHFPTQTHTTPSAPPPISHDNQIQSDSEDDDFDENIFFCELGYAPLVSTRDLIANWNGWPQGHYHAHIPWSLVPEVDGFRVNWSTSTDSGTRTKQSSRTAEKVENGYKKIRKCLGLLECSREGCARITRSQSSAKLVANQVGSLCPCSDPNNPDDQYYLDHVPCDNVATIIQYAGGIWYCNGMPHEHEIIPRTAHLSKSQKSDLQRLVQANPTATAAALRAGNTRCFADKKAARYEVGKVAPPKAPSGEEWIQQFSAFRKANPGVIITNVCGDDGVVVISIQTPFMAQQLADASKNGEGLRGIVSDAAQKWFRAWSSCLITTSVYSPILSGWVPAVYSYANGETALHYQYHFEGVFHSMELVKEEQGEEMHDSDFAGVVDFSQAQHNGGREAFIRNRLANPKETRTREQLAEVYDKDINVGCHYHFHTGVVRVKKLVALDCNSRSEVIEDRQAEFEALAQKLLRQDTAEGFLAVSKTIKSQFPKSKPWMEWWERPDHVGMLVIPKGDFRKALPNTTNAQESAHAAMYTKHGMRHDLMPGLIKLKLIADEMEKTWLLESLGATGNAETERDQRQRVRQKYGQTKRSRTKKGIEEKELRRRLPISDSRPPDTIRTLLTNSGTKTDKEPKKSVTNTKRKRRDSTTTVSESSSESASDSDSIPLAHSTNSTRKQPHPVTPRITRSRKIMASLVSSPTRPLKSPIVHKMRAGHQTPKDMFTPSPKKVTFSDIMGDSIPPRASEFSGQEAGAIQGNIKLEVNAFGSCIVIIAAGQKILIGYDWAAMSCWVDTTMEMLTWVIFRCLKSVQAIFAKEGGGDLAFKHVFDAINTRLSMLLQGTPEQKFRHELTMTKGRLRKFIVEPHSGYPEVWTQKREANTPDNDVSWLSSCLQFSPRLQNMSHNFAVLKLPYKFCTGGSIPDDTSHAFGHYNIAPIQREQPVLTLKKSLHKHFKGDFTSFIRSMLDVTSSALSACWRATEGHATCSGDSVYSEPTLSLPHILTLEVDMDQLSKPGAREVRWNFPAELVPFENPDAKKAGVVYDIVARSFYNGGHYIGRFVAITDTPTRAPAVYTYDGYKNKGTSFRESKGVVRLLSGVDVEGIGDGYHTSAVYYVLRGGQAAQDWVWRHQTDALRNHTGISINPNYEDARNLAAELMKPGYMEVAPDNHHWLSQANITSLKTRFNPAREYEAQRISDPWITGKASNHGNVGTETESLSDRESIAHDLLALVADDLPERGSKRLTQKSETLVSSDNDDDSDNISFLSMEEPPSSSPRGSPVPVQCRCGETVDGDRQQIKQTIVQCGLCETWHHMACQLGGEAAVPEDFTCHMCSGTPAFWGSWKKRFHSEHPVDLDEVQSQGGIAKRVFRRMTVLTKDSGFWYPARLIEFLKKEDESIVGDTQCLVKYWRHTQPVSGAKHQPGCYAKVPVKNMRDGLSNSVVDRRQTRLGLWKTTREVNEEKMQAEEGQTPLKSAPYTTEIRHILEPHISRLGALVHRRNELSSRDYPTIWYQEEKKRPEVDLTGGLQPNLRSQIQNYMYNCVPGMKTLKKHTWVTDGPLQDAFMLYIAHRDEKEFAKIKGCPRNGEKRTNFICARAWECLVAYTGKTEDGGGIPAREDVDYQSLALLEDRMFAPQFNTGEAGQQQWGLDVGIHQCDWDPYPHFPDENGRLYHAWENKEVGDKFQIDRYTLQWRRKAEEKALEKLNADEERRKIKPRPQPRRIQSKRGGKD